LNLKRKLEIENALLSKTTKNDTSLITSVPKFFAANKSKIGIDEQENCAYSSAYFPTIIHKGQVLDKHDKQEEKIQKENNQKVLLMMDETLRDADNISDLDSDLDQWSDIVEATNLIENKSNNKSLNIASSCGCSINSSSSQKVIPKNRKIMTYEQFNFEKLFLIEKKTNSIKNNNNNNFNHHSPNRNSINMEKLIENRNKNNNNNSFYISCGSSCSSLSMIDKNNKLDKIRSISNNENNNNNNYSKLEISKSFSNFVSNNNEPATKTTTTTKFHSSSFQNRNNYKNNNRNHDIDKILFKKKRVASIDDLEKSNFLFS
jgi:hypothetical protein